jgi:hypothetical protein
MLSPTIYSAKFEVSPDGIKWLVMMESKVTKNELRAPKNRPVVGLAHDEFLRFRRHVRKRLQLCPRSGCSH